jgi:Fe-S-cluster containining protein
MNADVIQQVKEIFAQIDRQTAVVQAATGLNCPAGCGRCCENPEVETTVLEMIPLALELWQRGEALEWLSRSQAVENRGVCVLYQPDPFVPGNGRCSAYEFRPSICRLFALATVTNKQGKPELAACVRHKEIMPETVQEAKAAIADGLPAPNFAEISIQLAMLDPSGCEKMPINQALTLALQRVGLIAQLAGYGGE